MFPLAYFDLDQICNDLLPSNYSLDESFANPKLETTNRSTFGNFSLSNVSDVRYMSYQKITESTSKHSP